MIDSFEFTKIAGAVLSALLVIFGTKTAIEVGWHAPYSKPGFELPAAEEAATPAKGAPAAPTFDAAKVVATLATAKPENGQATFKKCAACHTADKGGPNKIGPNLWDIVGRKVASHEGFAYSDAMKKKGGEWTYEELVKFVHNPKGIVAGTKMVFAGIADEATLADLVAYLRTLNDKPPALPK